jgi:hypothetical protein
MIDKSSKKFIAIAMLLLVFLFVTGTILPFIISTDLLPTPIILIFLMIFALVGYSISKYLVNIIINKKSKRFKVKKGSP